MMNHKKIILVVSASIQSKARHGIAQWSLRTKAVRLIVRTSYDFCTSHCTEFFNLSPQSPGRLFKLRGTGKLARHSIAAEAQAPQAHRTIFVRIRMTPYDLRTKIVRRARNENKSYDFWNGIAAEAQTLQAHRTIIVRIRTTSYDLRTKTVRRAHNEKKSYDF